LKAIILSGMPAVGKTTVSRKVAEVLGVSMVGGGDVLKEMAVEQGYSPGGEDWWDMGDGMKFLQERKRSSDFDKEVDARLMQKAKKGSVVISSYPIPWLTRDGIRVWLAGSVRNRASRMSRRDGIPVAKCVQVLSIRDQENYRLYKKIYGIEFGKDLKPFDLVIETDSIDESKVAEIIIEYARNRRD